MQPHKSFISSTTRTISDEPTIIAGFRGGVLPELNNGLQRVGHTIVTYKHDLYLYGGYGPKNLYSTAIFCNVKMTLQWKEIRGVGVIPTGRANHTAIMHENKMIIFGGHRNLEVFDDLYIFTFGTMRWEKVNYEKAQGPGPVFSHVAVYVPPTQNMIIIGGFHQRQHNMYVAHSFDIRHRVWNGIRGPSSVNPLHVQMCAAAYNSATTSLVVIGMVEKEILTSVSPDIPSVFMMNVHSGIWVEVHTPSSPETPIPFRMSGVWEYFMREIITMGGVYDDKSQGWYFPLLLAPIEIYLMRRRSDRTPSLSTSYSKSRSRSKTTPYGFFKLQIQDMTWSIIPAKFPKRIISELMARKVSTIPTGGGGGGGGERRVERQSVHGHRKSKDSHGKKNIDPPLYSVSGVSRFQRKYAYVTIDPSGMRAQRSSYKLIVMHGGLTSEDYIMLLFTPILKKRPTASPNFTDSFVAFSETDTFTFPSISRMGNSIDQSSTTWDDDMSETESELSRVVNYFGNKKKVIDEKTEDDIDTNIMVGRLHHIDSDPTLLPILANTRSKKNEQRFAVLYHPRSAIHSDKLLPDPSCPVAVLNKDTEIKAWAENFYTETRQWIASNIEAAKEEEKIARRNKRKARRSSKNANNENDDDSSDFSSIDSRDTTDTKQAQTSSVPKPPDPPAKPKDFFLEKNLEVFSLENAEIRRVSYYSKSPFLLPGETTDNIGRLRMSVKRYPEVRRLPSAVFQRTSLGNVMNDGGATAFLLMESALARFEDGSDESRRQRALIRWRYLRVMVLNGEAAFIMHRARQEEGKGRGLDVSSTAQLALAPDLHTKGANPMKVTTKPIPYAVPAPLVHNVRSSEMTPSGYVMYHSVKNVK